MTEAVNHRRIWPLVSTAMRRERPDFRAAAERESEKLSLSAMASTRSRVLADTRSGLVKERETVEMETPASRATS